MTTYGALDIGKAVVAYRLEGDRTSDYRKLLREGTFLKLEPSRNDINRCLQFFKGCDYVAMEPTGTYSRIWIEHLRNAGIEIKLVRHDRLSPYRKNLDLPDKDDRADALALALYLREHIGNPYRFIWGRDQPTEAIRAKVLRLGSLTRMRTGLIARIKALLADEFPEKLNYKSNPHKGNPPLLWRWIPGISKSEKLDLEMRRGCGVGISKDSQLYARHLCDYYRREVEIQQELLNLLALPQYERYLEIFKLLGFGLRTKAIILSQIFPIQKFYSESGEPDREWRGKYFRDYSLRRFKKSLGIAPQQFQSGEGAAKISFSGSGYCRQALLMPVLVRVEVSRCRLSNPEFQKVVDYFDKLKGQKMPPKKRRFKTAAKMVEVIYRYLIR